MDSMRVVLMAAPGAGFKTCANISTHCSELSRFLNTGLETRDRTWAGQHGALHS